jgi:hypothetical protein
MDEVYNDDCECYWETRLRRMKVGDVAKLRHMKWGRSSYCCIQYMYINGMQLDELGLGSINHLDSPPTRACLFYTVARSPVCC